MKTLLLFLCLCLSSAVFARPAKEFPVNVTVHHVETFAEACFEAYLYAVTVQGAGLGHVSSGSMEPTFPAKRTVYVIEPGLPEVGEPFVFKYEGRAYVHQLTRAGYGRYVTAGTNPRIEDAGYRTKADIVGVVRHVWVSANP